MNTSIIAHLATLSPEALNDLRAGQWDEIMTDALYAACGASTVEEMAEARSFAEANA
jgi:hypothetical protein